MPRLPMRIPEVLIGLTSDVPETLFDETFRRATERLDGFVGALALELAAELGLGPGDLPDLDTLLARRAWSERGKLAVRWAMETLELYGWAERAGEGWRLAGAVPESPSAALRADAERLIPSSRPAYEVLARCATALPAILRGELRGEEALFGPATLGLWFEYFSNANPHYGPNNAITALALARSIRPSGRVLEVGGGGGSAAEAALAALGAAGKGPAEYVFTELQPAFLRRGARAARQALPEGCELRSLRYDINRPPAGQGVEHGWFDAVFGVNTLHLAHDPVGALRQLGTVLRPGGVIVLGELLRPTPTGPVHLELPFTVLEDYSRAPLIDGIRARPGFISARGWLRALEAAGFHDVAVLPAEVERCAEIYPGFYCGALTAFA